MSEIEELRAAISAASAPPSADALAIGTEPTSVPAHLSARAKANLLEARRTRYLDEANSVVEDRAVLSDTETLFVRRLLDAVSAIDAELPRYRELASTDEQHAETMRKYSAPPSYFRD